uniref:Uncharacterized protein n=1 Tax=Caenorhabditis japonica TaxID=281687 RepID=A0A8R1DTT4_CAEJA
MIRITIIALAFFVSAFNANIFGSILGGNEKEVATITVNEETQNLPIKVDGEPNETNLAVIGDDEPVVLPIESELSSEGQTGVVIRAKRYYGCGCGCCGCATLAPNVTLAPCGCGCCGCGYGK